MSHLLRSIILSYARGSGRDPRSRKHARATCHGFKVLYDQELYHGAITRDGLSDLTRLIEQQRTSAVLPVTIPHVNALECANQTD